MRVAPKRKKAVKSERKQMRGAARKNGRTHPSARGKDRAKTRPDVAVPIFAIRELDPVRVCGDRTSVVALFRVDERKPKLAPNVSKRGAADGRQVHLVFNDRHGWYCEHGRSCHAVGAVMKHARIR
jgi:hypothetical protein